MPLPEFLTTALQAAAQVLCVQDSHLPHVLAGETMAARPESCSLRKVVFISGVMGCALLMPQSADVAAALFL